MGYSQNHMMLGAIDEWFTSGLAGIQQAPGFIGYEKIFIKPAIVGDLSHVEGSYRTPKGLIESSWTKSAYGRLTMRVSIPASTNAIIYVPSAGGPVTYSVGPGIHEFTGLLE